MKTRQEQIFDDYLKAFNEPPMLPQMANYTMILNLMEDAIIRNKPLTSEEIMVELDNEEDYRTTKNIKY